MIKITDIEKIKTKGDFKLDGLLIKKHSFEKQTTGAGTESLVIEAVPFTKMDDGSLIYYPSEVYKVVITDLIGKMYAGSLSAECVQAMLDAYYATEKATAMMMTELGGVACSWEAPQ